MEWTRQFVIPWDEAPPMTRLPDLDPQPDPSCISGEDGCHYEGTGFVCDVCRTEVCWCQGGTEPGYEFTCTGCWAKDPQAHR